MYENACYTNTEDSCHYVYDTDYVEKCYTKYTRLVTFRVVLQGDQLNMAVFFLYLGKRNLFSVIHVYSIVHGTSKFLQGTTKTRPYITGHSVHLG